ncbi:11832_t:CDS:2 [Dentiscutata heterogama]|uniref:11832_t:CDS:1 n=1 Tax=Dentiscutata heterogama TaxID=1316150 RepID=A0ACA9M513_9GLOM|nr:11832_t:CDS:2 [Dentiscutata heterogama]
MSFGANVDQQFVRQSVLNFYIHGQVYHCIGSLLSEEGHTPTFAQLYIYDTMHEVENRCNIMNHFNELSKNILQTLQSIFNKCNPYIQNFHHVRDNIQENLITTISMIIHAWFQENKNNHAACKYIYIDFSTYYTWTTKCKWVLRQISISMLARLYMVQPSEGNNPELLDQARRVVQPNKVVKTNSQSGKIF